MVWSPRLVTIGKIHGSRIPGPEHLLPFLTDLAEITNHNEASVDETSVHKDPGRGHSVDHGILGRALCDRHFLLLRFARHLVAGRAPHRPAPWSYDSVGPITVSEASVW